MPNYRRHRVPGGCYFFTVNLLERKKHLLTEHIDVLREAFRTVKQKTPFHIDAIVILPEHLHCIWTLPEGDDDYSGRWRAIKKHFSKQLPVTERRSATRQKRHERGIWQRRFWEHTIRDERVLVPTFRVGPPPGRSASRVARKADKAHLFAPSSAILEVARLLTLSWFQRSALEPRPDALRPE